MMQTDLHRILSRFLATMKHIIYPIKALTDNYVWAVFSKESNSCLIVDPGESDPVKNFLHSKQLEICGNFSDPPPLRSYRRNQRFSKK